MSKSAIEHIPCDGAKLKAVCEAKGYTLTKIADMAGYTQTWLSKGGVRGWLTPPQMKVLESIGVTREDITPDSDGGNVETGDAVNAISQGDLYETINDAVTDALRGMNAEFQRVIFDAMKDALAGG